MELQGPCLQMQAMGTLSAGYPMFQDSRFYYFSGSAMSLQSRLETMPDNEAEAVIDATITITGVEIKPKNTMCEMCTFIWGSLILLPLFLLCFNPWKRCAYAAYDIPESVYRALSKLINGPNIRNLTLNVTDNMFGREKAETLFHLIEKSKLQGFTFINNAGAYDFDGHNYSVFE